MPTHAQAPDAQADEDDDLLELLDDEPAAESTGAMAAQPWLVLVVDDDPDVHLTTEMALRDLWIEGRPLTLLHAHSRDEAIALVQAHDELAVVLLDVVMDSEDAGLQVARAVRDVMRREALRIILRTGQPGYAPEMETIRAYDINDYRTKSELTRVRLFTSLTVAVRVFRQMRAHEQTRRGLEMVVRASNELSRSQGMHLFAQGVVSQLCALLGIEPEGLICAQAGLRHSTEPAHVIAAAGRYGNLLRQPLDQIPSPAVQQALQQCLNERRSSFEHSLTLYFATSDGRGLAAYVDHPEALQSVDRRLVEVFCASMSACFENVLLYGQLVDQAYVDPLLHIPNLNQMLQILGCLPPEVGSQTLAVIDIDGFAGINDMLGHGFGDAVLRGTAQRLREQMGHHCHLARLGADQFGVLGPSSEVCPARLMALFDTPFQVQAQAVRLTATMGLVRLDEHSARGGELLKCAHLALKRAKGERRGIASYFTAAMGEEARARMVLLEALRGAAGSMQMYTVYQPKVNLRTGEVIGFEALLRWRLPDGQMVPPDRFVPVAEQAGLMMTLGSIVTHQACSTLRRLHEAGHTHLGMAINVSHAQFREPDFLPLLGTTLADTGVDVRSVELEITESMAAEDLTLIRQRLDALHEMGLSLAIDDFGTGYSSLAILRHLPTQRLKIDRAFVIDVEHDSRIAQMIVQLGHVQGMQVIAEGVETEAQRRVLLALGCDEGQGWLFGKAMPEDELVRWLAGYRPAPVAD
jgi:diguanylate cyclase (GGDEF)-like protein